MIVAYKFMLLCILNFAYVNCVIIEKLKRNDVEKKLSSVAEKTTFVDTSWVAVDGLYEMIGSVVVNPYEQYMKRFDKPNNDTLKPIKHAQFGNWDKNKLSCEVLKEKKISDKKSETEKNATECGAKLLNLSQEDASKNYVANWNPTENCLIYEAQPNCLSYKLGGYVFVSNGTVNTEVYDLPPCIYTFRKISIKANCQPDGNETTFNCINGSWVAQDKPFSECFKEETTISKRMNRDASAEHAGENERTNENTQSEKEAKNTTNNQTIINQADKLLRNITGIAGNGTASSAGRYCLSLRGIGVTFMLIFTQFIIVQHIYI